VALRPGEEEVDQAAWPSRQAGHRSGCSRPRAPFGPGEPRWGYQRIQGELLGLDPGVCHHHRHCPSGPSSRSQLRGEGRRGGEFLIHQASGIIACDLLTVETIWLRTLYVLFFVELGTRRVRVSDRESGFGLGHPASTKRRQDTRRTGDLKGTETLITPGTCHHESVLVRTAHGRRGSSMPETPFNAPDIDRAADLRANEEDRLEG
jgi:hypothetical protein